jgi:TonB family protein
VFELLQHPPRSPERSPFGATVSVVVHAVVVVSLVAGTRQSVIPSDELRESIIQTALSYLLPPDKKGTLASEPLAEWTPSRTGAPQTPLPESAWGTLERQKTGAQAKEDTEASAPVPLSEAATALDAYTLLGVDSGAVRDPESAAPAYPALLQARGIEGVAVVRFVVDTTGRADVETFQLMETNHALFGKAVRDALPHMKFNPATIGAKKVRQLVELPFAFVIRHRADASAAKKP